jgi:hypothetical protein
VVVSQTQSVSVGVQRIAFSANEWLDRFLIRSARLQTVEGHIQVSALDGTPRTALACGSGLDRVP